MVVEAVLRNYPPVEPFVVAWEERHIALREDLMPEKETEASVRSKMRTGPTIDDVSAWALEYVTAPMESSFLKEILKDEFVIGKSKVDNAIK